MAHFMHVDIIESAEELYLKPNKSVWLITHRCDRLRLAINKYLGQLLMTTRSMAKTIHDRPARIILRLTGLGLVIYIAWAIFGAYDISMHPEIATFSLAIMQSLAAYFSYRVVRNSKLDVRLRNAWRWISRALASSALAEGLWFAYSFFQLAPMPWLTDVLYFLYYIFILVALFWFPFITARRTERIIFWLDLIIIMLATLVVLWAMNLERFQELYIQDPLILLSLVFPLGDAVLFAGMMALLQRDVERVGKAVFIFLTLAFGLHGLAGGFYLYARMYWFEWLQLYVYILWLLGAFCFLIAAVVQTNLDSVSREIYPSRTRFVLRFILPYLAVIAGWSTLVYMTFTIVKPNLNLYGVLIGSILLGVLVLLRQYNLLLENVHLYADMQRLAITDSLTGLYNRHYFNQVLNRELQRAERYNSPLVLLLADVDDFKLFNDTLGHMQGDQVLRLVSNVLNTQLRRVDLLARFGGDEFAVIMPGTDRAGALTVTQRIHAVFAGYQYAGRQLGLSIGIAVHVAGITPEQFVEQADRALYRSKSKKAARKTHPISKQG